MAEPLIRIYNFFNYNFEVLASSYFTTLFSYNFKESPFFNQPPFRRGGPLHIMTWNGREPCMFHLILKPAESIVNNDGRSTRDKQRAKSNE